MKKNKQKLLSLMVMGTVLILFIIFFQFKATIYGAFPQNKSNELSQEDIDKREEILQQDTDNDGLSDFEERYTYGTSQYLTDTDGDGFSDKEEIEAGSDPLNQLSTPYNKEIAGNEGEILQKTFSNLEDEEDQTEVTADDIRNLLIEEGGLSEEIVDKFDDKTLKSLYNETKQEFNMDLNSLEDL